jgi:hypothetical protein
MADSDSFSKGLMSQCILTPTCHSIFTHGIVICIDEPELVS